MKKEYSYGIIPIYKDKNGNIEILLIQNKNGNHRGFPKGHMESGENGIETAVRELLEETGLIAQNIQKIDTKELYIDYSKQKETGEPIEKHVGYFIGYINSKDIKIQKEEINNSIRLPLDQIEGQITHQSAKDILKEVKEIILHS
ncbi:NUDIX domain-containing protein [Candidatus Gracilibacteria bacterium]|nr:NUDIX domain-containing protein [Candidatus Gracilibacteria bacterium]